MKNYYYILGIEHNATLTEIKSVHRNLSKKFHPDLNPNDKHSEKMFIDIQEAYECLSDNIKRQQYDKKYSDWLNNKQENPSSNTSSNTKVNNILKDEEGAKSTLSVLIIIGFIIAQLLGVNEEEHWILWGLAAGIALGIFMTPFLVATYYRNPLKWAVFAATLILGWTGLGWLGCLAFAFYSKES